MEYQVAPYWAMCRVAQIAPVSREMVLNYVAQHMLGLEKSYES
jgi:alkylation response protein AidB-like acyl-CoA dehydrogenase